MGDEHFSVPKGWVPWSKSIHRTKTFLITFMFFSAISAVYFSGRVFNPVCSSLTIIAMTILAVLLVIVSFRDKGRNPGAFVRSYPAVRLPDGQNAEGNDFVHAFEMAVGELDKTADPYEKPYGWLTSSRLVYSHPTRPDEFITLAFHAEGMIEVGVSANATEFVSRIESFFETNGRLGSNWVEPEYGRDMYLTVYILLAILSSIPPLLLFSIGLYGLFLGAFGLFVFFTLSMIRFLSLNWLYLGSAYKEVVMREEDVADVLRRSAWGLGFSLDRSMIMRKAEKTTSKGDLPRFLSKYEVGRSGISVILSRGMMSGVEQGYITIHLEDFFKLDEMVAKKFEKEIESTLLKDSTDSLSVPFFDGFPDH